MCGGLLCETSTADTEPWRTSIYEGGTRSGRESDEHRQDRQLRPPYCAYHAVRRNPCESPRSCMGLNDVNRLLMAVDVLLAQHAQNACKEYALVGKERLFLHPCGLVLHVPACKCSERCDQAFDSDG